MTRATRMLRIPAIAAALLSLSACASLPFYEQPQVTVTSVALSPGMTALTAPRFDVGIRVVNPNRVPLPLRGMDWSLEVGGSRLVSGATRDLPRVPGNGAADFTLQVAPDIVGAARVLNEILAQRGGQPLGYTFRARLDVGGLVPDFRIEQSGRIEMHP